MRIKTLFRWSLRSLIIFVLLAGSIIGLIHKGVGAWAKTSLVPTNAKRPSNSLMILGAQFSSDSKYIVCAWAYRFEPYSEKDDRIIISCWDVRSGKRRWDSAELNGNIGILKSVEEDHSMVLVSNFLEKTTTYAIDLENGSVHLYAKQMQYEGWKDLPEISADGRHSVDYVKGDQDSGALYLMSPHRLSDWYEITWFPEFWLIWLFSIALIFSLWRDWKERKARG